VPQIRGETDAPGAIAVKKNRRRPGTDERDGPGLPEGGRKTMTPVRNRVDDSTADEHNDAAGRDPEKDNGDAGEPPDPAQDDTSVHGVPEAAGQDENEELNWARRHIREEPAAPRHEPARAPDRKARPEKEPAPEEEPEDATPIGRTGRGKGRPPHRMLKQAIAIAKERGGVIPIPGGRSDAFDMIVCEEFRNVFVRFRWSATQYLSARDVMTRYPRDVGRIVRMPLTGVMAWEFWLFEPGNLWQFFLFTHNGLFEIRRDGSIFYRPVLPVPAADSAGSSPSDGDSGKGDGYG
jgi:hypothetical protein